ncbi:hypothetical protein Ddye_004364 [Dipteronia dyeriana]|uniref:ATP-dependent DNA helicase n=1 Tax=Dipteronia dyeriana TaxID=168575 RepID=A0AAD9XUI3_9ROSI|nr:hypothetical protein Ddye_004364 [Dipteronia dyeriana]
MLQNINDSKQHFGGKVIVFGGDFRQVLPVVQKARKEEIVDATILTPKNDYVDDINNLLIEQFLGDAITYYSFDETIDKNEQAIQEDLLNSFTPSGFPPHQLVLKENCSIILLRNINPSEGLCNGTRLIYRRFSPNLIDAQVLNMSTQTKFIQEIRHTTKKWTTIVFVAEKSMPRKARQNTSKYQHLILIDTQGTRIQPTIFDKNIQAFEDTLIVFKKYYITNASVRPISPDHRVMQNEYQWIIDSGTMVGEIEKEDVASTSKNTPEFSFVPFSRLDTYTDIFRYRLHSRSNPYQ